MPRDAAADRGGNGGRPQAGWLFEYNMVNYNRGGSLMPGAAMDINWFAGSGWQERSEKLYSAAGHVAAALGKK